MSDTPPVVITRYASLARLGHWGVVDAKCETTGPDRYGLVSHYVTFVLLDRFGQRADLGHFIFGGWPDKPEVFDEDGDTHPRLDAAVRSHCQQNMTVKPMPGQWIEHKPRHELWSGSVETAF